MAGLLDILGTSMDDPKTMGLLALAGSMVKGDFGGGLLGYGQAYQGAQDQAMKRQLTKAQLDNYNSEVETRKAALQRQMEGQDFFKRLLTGGGEPKAPVNMGFGMPTSGAMMSPQPAPGPSGLAAASPEMIAAAKALYGMDLNDQWKSAKEGFQVQPNTYRMDATTGKLRYYSDPTKGISFNPDTGETGLNPGFANTQSQLTLASEGPKAVLQSLGQVNMRPMANGQQAPVPLINENPAMQQLGQLYGLPTPQRGFTAPQPQAQAQAPQERPMSPQPGIQAGTFQGDPAQISASIEQIRDPQERANARQSFEMQMRATGGNLPAYGKTTAQESRDAANKAFLEGRAKDSNAYESNLNGRVAQGTELNMRLQEQLAALQNFRAGGGAETRAQLAQMAQAIPGIPQSVVNGIAGGSLASMQEFNKLAAQTAMEQLKQSMGGAGRISQYEFKVFQNNNPNLSTDPDAIRKIFEFNNKIYRRDLSEQQAFNAHINSGGNPGDFPAQWAQRLAASGVTVPDMNTNATQAASLPTPVKGMVRNGYRFKGGDPSNPNSWEKQ